MRYSNKVQFVFLVVGYTKNAADSRLFHLLKRFCRLKNLPTMDKLFKVLAHPTWSLSMQQQLKISWIMTTFEAYFRVI